VAPGPPGGIDERQQAKDFLDHALGQQIQLLPAAVQEYRMAAYAIFDQMTLQAVERFNKHVGGYRFFNDLVSLNQHFNPTRPPADVAREVAMGLARLGAYNVHTGELEIDGGSQFAGRFFSPQYIFAHEFAHAVDGPQLEISGTGEWYDAWISEICSTHPGTNAARSPEDGFAKFGQLVHESGIQRTMLESQYPKSAAVWRKWSLW
jgi:hypothetical protein